MVLIDKHPYESQEEQRLKEDQDRTRYWKHWGPYVAERQWATGESLSLDLFLFLRATDDLILQPRSSGRLFVSCSFRAH